MLATFDLAVVGGGPAGAACALEAARRSRSVVLFEPRDGAPAWDKPCGEGIMPAGIDVLLRLGLTDVVRQGRPFDGIRLVVFGAPPIEVALPRPGVAIRRTALAAAFEAALAASPFVRRVRAAAVGSRTSAGFEIDAKDAGRFLARTLVAADGASGHGAPWLSGGRDRRRPSARFGLRARFRDREDLDRVEVHMSRGCEIYLTPLPDGVVNLALLFERAPESVRGPEALLAWALERYPGAAARLGEGVTEPEARALVRVRPRAVAEAGAFLAGDASGMVDPIVGCGVTIALRTGASAARGADAVLAGGGARVASRAHAAVVQRECAARHALATVLRRSDAHPRLARAVARVLSRVPRATLTLARIAAGPPQGRALHS